MRLKYARSSEPLLVSAEHLFPDTRDPTTHLSPLPLRRDTTSRDPKPHSPNLSGVPVWYLPNQEPDTGFGVTGVLPTPETRNPTPYRFRAKGEHIKRFKRNVTGKSTPGSGFPVPYWLKRGALRESLRCVPTASRAPSVCATLFESLSYLCNIG